MLVVGRDPDLENDGLPTPEVGPWAETKYRLVRECAGVLGTSTKATWSRRVYVDLFAGAGRSRVKGTSRILAASSVQALRIPDRFDRYIFCEAERNLIEGLKLRVATDYPGVDARFVPGDVNDEVSALLDEIPRPETDARDLVFCVADPCDPGRLRFDTVRLLASRLTDFLVLIPTGAGDPRGPGGFLRGGSGKLDAFVGTVQWEGEWQRAAARHESFDLFLAGLYGAQVRALGFEHGGTEDRVLVRSAERSQPLYRIGFFSKHSHGDAVWKQARKHSEPQRVLFE